MRTKKKRYSHEGVTEISEDKDCNLHLSFGEGLADVIYPEGLWEKVHRII